MTTDDLQQRLPTWLEEDATHRVPDHLDAVLAQTSTIRQRPAWASLERWLPLDVPMRAIAAPTAGRVGRLVLVGILVVALVGLALAFAGSRQRLPRPFGLAANGAFLTASNGDISVSSSPTGVRTPLVTGPEFDYGAWYSHDGTRFVFWREPEPDRQLLMIANADGSSVRPLITEPLSAADWFEWSPDDTRIAIVHGSGVRRVVSIVDTSSGAVRELALPDLDVDNIVLWRPPLGAELLFTARPAYGLPETQAIYALGVDGSAPRKLAERSGGDAFRDLDVSPDGRTATYWTEEATVGSATPSPRIHLLDLATLEDRMVSFDPTAAGESQLRFSPDGRTGVIVRHDARVRLAVVDLVGDAPPRVVGSTYAGTEQLTTMFSPDGRTFVLGFEAPAHPVLVDVASGEETTLPDTWNSYASWQRRAP